MTPKQARFVDEYLIDANATQAAIRAGYSARTAASVGQENLRKPEIEAAIAGARLARSERTQITGDQVLRDLWEIATADPNDLIEYRLDCCRHCHGEGFRFQETQGEREVRRAAWEADWLKIKMSGDRQALLDFGEFRELGGVGFDASKPPHPDCPECFGEGKGRVVIHETRTVQGPARRLFAGVKVTRDGIQVLMRSQDGALSQLFDHLGLAAPRRQQLTGLNGGPIETLEVADELAGLPREKRDRLRELLATAMANADGS